MTSITTHKKANALYNNHHAVSEIIGAMMLLTIAICTISVLYMHVISGEEPISEPIVTLLGKIESGEVVFEHTKGEPLSLDTEVTLVFGGNLVIQKKVGELLDQDLNNDGLWNIGEQLKFSEIDIGTEKVTADIADLESNSLVLWGTLQEGELLTSRGGIWHFDENHGDIANDSLNNNDGNLKPDEFFGPQWSEEDKAAGRSSLCFDGLNDYVQVPGNTASLYFTDQLTIEAWIKIPENNVLHNYIFGPDFGYEPNVIQITDEVWAVTYRDQGEVGMLKSIRIHPDGTLSDDVFNNSIDFGDKCYWPKIVHVSGDIYLVAYATADNLPQYVYVKTIEMLDNGTIIDVLAGQSFDKKEVQSHNILKISDNLSVICFNDDRDHGYLKLIQVPENGTVINVSVTNGFLEFESIKCSEPDILSLGNDLYAIIYRGVDDHGYVKTVHINDAGPIFFTLIDDFEFNQAGKTLEPVMVHVNNTTYGLLYRDNEETGFITTIDIADNGAIYKSVLDHFVFEDDYCVTPDITKMSEEIFLVAYKHDLAGFAAVVNIKDNGSISLGSKFQFTTDNFYFGYEPDVFRVTDDVFGIAFRTGTYGATPHEGLLITGRLSGINSGGNGQYNDAVVFRKNMFGISLNKTAMSGFIGTNYLISENIGLNSGWNQIVFTYNNSEMKLYLNGVVVVSDSYSGGIPFSTADVFFGRTFYGCIDEISILAQAITDSDVQYRYNNPGVVE